jgi:hypothetical protein
MHAAKAVFDDLPANAFPTRANMLHSAVMQSSSPDAGRISLVIFSLLSFFITIEPLACLH